MSRTKSPLDSQSTQVYEDVTTYIYPPLSLSLYSELIKSKQTFLLLYTAIFAYLISSWNTNFELYHFILFLVGLFFAVSGSTLLNMYIDRDIDALMERTKDRPLPSKRIPPSTVLKHGVLFTVAGILAVGIFTNLITMFIVFLGFFFDVVVYSLLLKRRTRLSIIFGGIAGGLPAVAGRVAVIGYIDIAAILMGAFVLCWIPLHILTLALIPKNLEGYKNANVPMWPVTSSKIETIRVITLSALLSALLIILTGVTLQIHLIPMLPLLGFSAFIVYKSLVNLKHPSDHLTFKIFKLASIYMAFAFLWLYLGVVISPFFII
ncbi:MAG: protoheme IX farnesyltransferase [Candidatus Heimdallarchaeota archaeon]|nr:MAG: protoheme IX farnesyltransferase [Candidatus Heimdallarchaeota archaeon]